MFRCLASIVFIAKATFAFDLMLDIGHTPSKSGAMSASCEKEFNYNIALGDYLLNHLANSSAIKIYMLPQSEISFQERYESSAQKDLFLSLHHDSVQERYIQRNSLGCPTTNQAIGFSIFISRKNNYFKKSYDYAERFGEALLKQGLTPSLHHAEKIPGENRELLDRRLGIYVFDDLKVLKNAKSPAMLFEAGVIVNPVDEAIVKRDEYKSKIIKAILLAFE